MFESRNFPYACIDFVFQIYINFLLFKFFFEILFLAEL